MKQFFLTLAVALSVYCSYAQTNTFPSSGNAGLGTTTPPTIGNYGVLALNGSSPSQGGYLSLMTNGTEVGAIAANSQFGFQAATGLVTQFYSGANPTLQISATGNVGIGTISPATKLDIVGGTIQVTNPNPTYALIDNSNSGYNWVVQNTAGAYRFYDVTANAERMRISSSGNVGIGTTNPGTYRLAVSGGIHSQSVNVDLTGWSDYVFNQDYKLPSLTEVKSYIEQNHHLPDMPSEQEVIKDGINLGEMNKLLTKKVEELTLYLIRKDKQIQDQQTQLLRQQQTNQSLQEQIDNLSKAIKKQSSK